MHLKNEPNPAMSAEVSNARFGSFAARPSRRQSPAMSVQFAGCDPPLWIARMAGIRGSLSSLRERFRARRGRAEPVIGRAFARPVGADTLGSNLSFGLMSASA